MTSPTFSAQPDAAMEAAHRQARETFKFFFRELHWERRHIVPALDLAVVKFAFRDPGGADVEQMWVDDVDFDGVAVLGRLLNKPNRLSSIDEGSPVTRPLSELSDWMISMGGKAYGGFTVAVIRSQMDARARQGHDSAWGLDFGDPKSPRMPETGVEHPMAVNMLASLEEHLRANPKAATQPDDRGWTLLHHLALSGNKACVELLLRLGADPLVRTRDGFAPGELALSLGWTELANALQQPRLL